MGALGLDEVGDCIYLGAVVTSSIRPPSFTPPFHHGHRKNRCGSRPRYGEKEDRTSRLEALNHLLRRWDLPLYVLNGIWPASGPVPSKEDVIGGISAIVWALTLIPLIKYVFISLFFGTKEGEGGSFALFQGLYPGAEKDFDADRTLTVYPSKDRIRLPLLIWSLFGTALTMADGVLTPAVSITSAVGGIAVAKPSVSSDIVPISIAFILMIFLVQQFGTHRLAFTFSPIALIWFLLLVGTGIYNIITFPGIFRAFDPSRAVMLFVRTKHYDHLAGILLAVTGSEAMFANLGQFNAGSIRISFCFFTYPALVLAYLGQGARLITDGEAVLDSVFYRTIPGPVNGPLYWIMFVFAVAATLVASQAMITATFSLTQQVINLKSLPPIRMVHTSDTVQGQVYVPAVNWILMILTIVFVAAFKDLAALTNAYGFAVATVMLSTTGLLAIQMFYVKRWPMIVAILFFIFWGFIDGLFWGASLRKVPHGAWVPLMIGGILTLLMTLWTWGKSLEDEFDGANRMNLRHFIGLRPASSTQSRRHSITAIEQEDNEAGNAVTLPEMYFVQKTGAHDQDLLQDEKIATVDDHQDLARIPVCAVFYKIAQGQGVPHTFVGFIRQWPALPRVVIFLSVCVLPCASVEPEDRYMVTKVRSLEGFYGVTYYLGFREEFDVQVKDVVRKIVQLERATNPNAGPIVQHIQEVANNPTHIAPHYHVMAKPVNGAGFAIPVLSYLRKLLIEDLYRRLATMFPETGNWVTSSDKYAPLSVKLSCDLVAN
ncbi:potassium transporter [Coprinellus micaceus]|uniref:Potassium transporter n=1 Tax=Coprinellus micaceus TaxID=71717 RepID=A0A4Y7U0P4_COPMI|nr:potassium transporter [Coprinellus micaceus]